MAWNEICRVCLQEGPLQPLITETGVETALGLKFNQCSPVQLSFGSNNNMPDQICESCIEDMDTTYRFRTNCESSNTILKSFVVTISSSISTDIPQVKSTLSESDTITTTFNYQPPAGLLVRRMKIPRVKSNMESHHNDSEHNEHTNTEEETQIMSQIDDGDAAQEEPTFDTGLEIKEESDPRTMDVIEFKSEEALEEDDELHPTESIYVYYSDSEIGEKPDDNVRLLEDDEPTAEVDHPEVMIKAVKGNKARMVSHAKKMNAAPLLDSDDFAKLAEDGNIFPVKLVRDSMPMKVCDICGNQYRYQHALESHLRRHRNDKPYVCTICGKGFVINFELNRHMRSHNGHKPYACKFCDRKFSDFGSRAKHERTHTGERPYSCATCGKSFGYSHVLSSHMLTHTGVKKFHCEKCGKRFAKSHHLKAHMNTHERNILVRMQHNPVTAPSTTELMLSNQIYDDEFTLMPEEEENSPNETIADNLQRQYVLAKLDPNDKDSVHLIEFSPSDLVQD